MLMLNRFSRWLAVAVAAIAFAMPAVAQTYPHKPIRILVGFGSGGSTDIVARLLAQSLSAAIGQPVVVENKPGAGARIAADVVAKLPTDGYTLLMGSAGIVVARAVGEKMSFDLLKDFVPASCARNV